jgi:predicted DsbA family dithiol-disulfide isomerase
MAKSLKIEFVSDISCGWCAIGLQAIEQALDRVGPEVVAELHFQPFELNPDMPSGGENLSDYLRRKYGEQEGPLYIPRTRQRGAEVGFEFNLHDDSRIYNTFDSHRILHWAALNGRQAALQHALFGAYFTDNEDPGSREVLLKCVEAVGLDPVEAGRVLTSGRYAAEVRELQAAWRHKGVHAVPTIIIDDKYLIQGTRSVEKFEQFIRSAADAAAEPGGEA